MGLALGFFGWSWWVVGTLNGCEMKAERSVMGGGGVIVGVGMLRTIFMRSMLILFWFKSIESVVLPVLERIFGCVERL